MNSRHSHRDNFNNASAPPRLQGQRPVAAATTLQSSLVSPTSTTTTNNDNGEPSTLLLRDAHRVLRLARDERIMVAHELLKSVERRLHECKTAAQEQDGAAAASGRNGSSSSSIQRWKFSLKGSESHKKDGAATAHADDCRAATELLESNQTEVDKLNQRAGVIERARDTLDQDEGWTLSQRLFGVTTFYRREDDNSLSLKLDGQLDGVPLFEQVAVLREVDLHYKWSPFCTSSMTLKELGKLDTVGWAVVGLPQFGLARDGCFRAFGCDCIMEDGSFFLVGQGVEDRPENVPYDEPFFLQDMEGIDIPDAPTRLGSGRMTIKAFSAVVHVQSPTSVRTRLVANVNPNLAFIPQSLLDFVMRKMCGVVFSKLQHAARRAADDPVRNAHAQQMRRNEAFYKDWLMPKFESYCNQLGWEMPPVAAFNLTDEQRRQAARLSDSHSTPIVRRLTSIESAPSTDGSGELHPSASAPDLQQQEVPHVLSGSTSGEMNGSSDSTSSAISSMSGSTSSRYLLRDNRISQYLRELEDRTQKVKARKIQEGRQSMAEQLRPKSISETDYGRLQELKQAKARRQRKRAATSSTTTVMTQQTNGEIETVLVESFSFGDRLHTHGQKMRFLVTLSLGFALQTSLHADRLFGFDCLLRLHADSIWMNILLDAATLLYLCVSATVFFAMSYVSLIYCFDSLNIGTMSGKKSKQFYGQAIRFLVAGTSGAIVAFSVGKAIAGVWFRVGLWYFSQAIRWARKELQKGLTDQHNLAWFLDNVPKPIQSVCATALSHVSPLARGFVGTGQSAVWFVQHWFVVIVVRSNFVGRALAAMTLRLFGIVTSVATAWEHHVSTALDSYTDEDVRLASWRGAAMDTARPFFAYTAVFLLSVLVLFNATARTDAKPHQDGKHDNESDGDPVGRTVAAAVAFDRSSGEPPTTPTSVVVAAPPARGSRIQSSLSIQEATIPEEGDEEISVSETQSCMTEMAVSTDAGRKKKRFRKLRLRKKKNRGDGDEGNSVHSSATGTSAKMKRLETY